MQVTEVSKAIVRIESGGQVGTGFLISQAGHVLTCRHILASLSIVCYLPDGTGKFCLESQNPTILTHQDVEQGDFAILQLRGDLPDHLVPLIPYASSKSEGHAIKTYGFPQAKPLHGMAGTAHLIATNIPSQFGFPLMQLTDANDLTDGFSGGPIVDPEVGGVVGMVGQITLATEDLRQTQLAFGISLSWMAEVCGEEFPVKLREPGQHHWPSGISPLPLTPLERKTGKILFADYLFGAYLPYLSRDDFAAAQDLSETSFPTESALLAQLLGTKDQPSLKDGLVIAGEGGVGKTRLMRELGLRALAQGWEVLLVDRSVPKLDILAGYIEAGTQYLLIFDYLEENVAFEVGEVDNLTQQLPGSEIKLIANCRNTHKNKSGAYPQSEFILEVELESDDPHEQAYREYLVKALLSDLPLEKGLPEKLARIAEIRPAFAVFVKYLLRLGKNGQAGNLGLETFTNFHAWLLSRLRLTLGLPAKDAKMLPPELFSFLAIFPINRLSKDLLRENEQYREWYSRLLQDGWIEREETETESYKVIHDTLVDSLLGNFLQAHEKEAYDRLSDALKFALRFQGLRSWLMSLERLQYLPFLSKFPDFADLFNRYLPDETPLQDWDCYSLARFSLISEPERLHLILEKARWFETFCTSLYFAKPLAFLTNQATRAENEWEGFHETIRSLHHGIHAANPSWSSWYGPASRLISTYLKLFGLNPGIEAATFSYLEQNGSYYFSSFVYARYLQAGGSPERIKAFLLWYLKFNARFPNSQFVLSAWLIAGGVKEVVQSAIEQHLTIHAADPKAQFVFKAWLDAKGDKQIVQGGIEQYLGAHATDPEASFVVEAWLNAQGDPQIVQAAIEQYLEAHATDPKAPYLVQAWLNAQGEKQIVQAAIEKYLGAHATDPEARFAFKAWLDAGGDKQLVQAAIEQHLAAHATDPEARFVLQAWLNAGGDKQLVQAAIEQHLAAHAPDSEARFVLQAWLNAGGDKQLVQAAIEQHLAAHAPDSEARFVFTAWLDAGGDKQLVQGGIEQYLAAHATDPEASFVVQAWLNAGGDKQVVQAGIEQYLAVHATDPEASFVVQAWLNAGGDKQIVQAAIEKYLEAHATDPEAQFVFKAWLDAKGEKQIVQAAIEQYLAAHATDPEAQFVFKAWLDAKGEKQIVQAAIEKYLEAHATDPEARFVFKAWLDAGGDKQLVQAGIEQYLAAHEGVFDTSYVISPWVKAGGEWQVVKQPVRAWLQNHRNHSSAFYHLSSWLSHEKSGEAVAEVLQQWITRNAHDYRAYQLLQRWIEVEEELLAIQEVWESCLNKHLTIYQTSFALQAWIIKHGPEYPGPSVQEWLIHHGTNPKANYLYQIWLDHGGDPSIIASGIADWLLANQAHPVRIYVLQKWESATRNL